MDCPHCSAEVNEHDKYCHECGCGLSQVEPASKKQALVQYAGDVAREGRGAAAEGLGLVKKGLQTETGKSVASCAVLGAAVGSIIPLVGTAVGATVGATLGLIRKI
jgi:hypothetical protein